MPWQTTFRKYAISDGRSPVLRVHSLSVRAQPALHELARLLLGRRVHAAHIVLSRLGWHYRYRAHAGLLVSTSHKEKANLREYFTDFPDNSRQNVCAGRDCSALSGRRTRQRRSRVAKRSRFPRCTLFRIRDSFNYFFSPLGPIFPEYFAICWYNNSFAATLPFLFYSALRLFVCILQLFSSINIFPIMRISCEMQSNAFMWKYIFEKYSLRWY